MHPSILLVPSGAALAVAALSVAGGAPLFSDGLRALRLRRSFARLRDNPLTETASGLVQARGRVALESPLFAPLSGAPCACYELEVSGVGTRVARSVHVRRPFRLDSGPVSARVLAEDGCWDFASTGEREVAPGETLTENLRALIGSIPEVRWLRASGIVLRLVERALPAGAECHVVGFARAARPYELAETRELAMTGTGGAADAVFRDGGSGEPSVWIGNGDDFGFLFVSDRAPRPEEVSIPVWRTAGVATGPVLGLLGLLYLAWATQELFGRGRF